MKKSAAALALMLSGCGTMQLGRAPEVSEPACTASCDAHYDQCPQIFSGFPERAAVECPAEHNNCLRACARHSSARTAAASTVLRAPPPAGNPAAAVAATSASPAHAVASKEARLRELKHFYDEGLVSEDVYRDRQRAILAEP
ncbi:MAG TPA: hypothetical protein VN692_08765 [Steroidobacteraceae bacterium]|nr:hypothetical protein [Steroidobacteraceae bacterium]